MGEESKKKPVSGFAKELGADWVKGGILLLFPTVTTVVTTVNAVMRDLPLWAIVTASTVVLCAAITAIRSALDVSYRITIKGRLIYFGSACVVHQKANKAIDQLGIGLNLFNQASQAIEYKVTSISLIIDGRVHPRPTTDDVAPFIMAPQTSTQYRADLVSVGGVRPNKAMDYTYRATIEYGAAGDRRHTMEIRLRGAFVPKSVSEIGLFEALYD
jgi:hypothetical protein